MKITRTALMIFTLIIFVIGNVQNILCGEIIGDSKEKDDSKSTSDEKEGEIIKPKFGSMWYSNNYKPAEYRIIGSFDELVKYHEEFNQNLDRYDRSLLQREAERIDFSRQVYLIFTSQSVDESCKFLEVNMKRLKDNRIKVIQDLRVIKNCTPKSLPSQDIKVYKNQWAIDRPVNGVIMEFSTSSFP